MFSQGCTAKTGYLFHRVSPLVLLIFTFTFFTPTEKGLIDHRDHLGLEQTMQLPKRGPISAGDEDTNTITKHEPWGAVNRNLLKVGDDLFCMEGNRTYIRIVNARQCALVEGGRLL